MLEHLHLLLVHFRKTDLRIMAIKEGVRHAVPPAAKTAGHHPPPPATQPGPHQVVLSTALKDSASTCNYPLPGHIPRPLTYRRKPAPFTTPRQRSRTVWFTRRLRGSRTGRGRGEFSPSMNHLKKYQAVKAPVHQLLGVLLGAPVRRREGRG